MTQRMDRDDLEVHRVVIAVFVEVPAVDLADASYIAQAAIRDALKTSSVNRPQLTVMARFTKGEVPVTVHKLMDTGMAAGNGYLWTQPTSKAYRDQGE